MTNNWRISVSFPKEVENAIVELRKRDEYCRMSYSELIRMLIERGLEKSDEDKTA